MYGITYIWVIFRANVGKYSIHGAYGYMARPCLKQIFGTDASDLPAVQYQVWLRGQTAVQDLLHLHLARWLHVVIFMGRMRT